MTSPPRDTSRNGSTNAQRELERKVQIIEQSPDRLLLAIEAAGRGATSIAVFAVVWNAISWTCAVVFTGDGALGQMGLLGVIPFLMLGLFLAIGVVLIVWAVKSMFGRAFVLVERDRASVQTMTLGWKRTKSVEMGPASVAELEEGYRQNDVPVYRVKITGPNGAVRFGLALPHADKLWAVETINGMIAPSKRGDAVVIPVPLNSFEAIWQTAENARAVDPMNLSAGSLVRVVEAGNDRLEYWMPLLPRPVGLLSASLAFIVLSLIVGFVWSAGVGGGDAFVVFLLPFLLVLILQAIACVAIFRGRITVQVDAQQTLVRWHVGAFGPSKSLPTDSVDKVAVIASGEAMRHLAMIGGGTTTIPLTTFHGRGTDEDAAGLVRWQLERLGHSLS